MDSELLQRRFDRERAARKQAEALLEQKSLELYRANEDLRKLADNLENQVQERTAELVRARDEALQANRHKSEFLSRMSHELRTPMNSILGFSQLLESDPVDPLTPGQLESLNEITRAGRHLLELINEVLDLARIESGRLNLNPEEVDLPELLDECLSLVAPMAEQRGIRLVNHFAEVSACRLQADPLRLRQILLNLLSNGVKYNREGGLLEVERPQLHNGKLSLAIRDTGLGIDPAGLQQVFEPFTRVGEEHTVEGTGIGLTISKRLIEMMDGEIGAESTPGEGSRFWIRLPCPDDGLILDGKAEAEPVEAEEPTARFRVLYMDDNPANLKLVDRLLRRHGDIETIPAPGAELGLELATAHLPDLILMDLDLPGIDAHETLHRIRQNPGLLETPVIALSAHAPPSEQKRGLEAGFHAYLATPIRMDKLVSLLDELLGA